MKYIFFTLLSNIIEHELRALFLILQNPFYSSNSLFLSIHYVYVCKFNFLIFLLRMIQSALMTLPLLLFQTRCHKIRPFGQYTGLPIHVLCKYVVVQN